MLIGIFKFKRRNNIVLLYILSYIYDSKSVHILYIISTSIRQPIIINLKKKTFTFNFMKLVTFWICLYYNNIYKLQ